MSEWVEYNGDNGPTDTSKPAHIRYNDGHTTYHQLGFDDVAASWVDRVVAYFIVPDYQPDTEMSVNIWAWPESEDHRKGWIPYETCDELNGREYIRKDEYDKVVARSLRLVKENTDLRIVSAKPEEPKTCGIVFAETRNCTPYWQCVGCGSSRIQASDKYCGNCGKPIERGE